MILDIDVWGDDRRGRAPLDVDQVKMRFGVAWSLYWRGQSRQPPYPRRSWIEVQQLSDSCVFLAEASPPEAEHLVEQVRALQRAATVRRYATDLGLSVY